MGEGGESGTLPLRIGDAPEEGEEGNTSDPLAGATEVEEASTSPARVVSRYATPGEGQEASTSPPRAGSKRASPDKDDEEGDGEGGSPKRRRSSSPEAGGQAGVSRIEEASGMLNAGVAVGVG